MSSIPREPQPAAPILAAEARPVTVEAVQMRGLVAGGVILSALVLFVFWDFFESQIRFAVKQQADWGHTLIIPLIAGYFVYLKRGELLAAPFKTTWIGLVPVVVGVGWYVICWLGPQTIRHHNLQGAGLSITLFGLTLLFVGFRAMAVLWFPLLYLCLFGQTISERLMNYVTYPMQDVTARGSWVVLNIIGIDTDRAGNILTVWDNGVAKPLNIAEACSGMRMLMAFLALGVAMAYTGLKLFWQQAALVLLGIPTAIVVNILRVVTLAILGMYDANFAAGDFHTFIGLLWLVPAFLMYLGLQWMLRQLVVEGKHA